MTDRVMIFIDGSNLLKSWQAMFPGDRLDYLKLKTELTNNRTLIRPCFYGSIHPMRMHKERPFHDFLQYNGFSTVILPLRKRGESFIEKGVDVALVTDMLSQAYNNAYDIAILISGDQDFLKALERIKQLGKRVEIAYFDSDEEKKPKLIGKMKRIADKFIDLGKLKNKIKQ